MPEWLDREFTLIDTGGIKFNTEEGLIYGKVKQQAQLAIEEAAVIIFVVDITDGLTADDEDVAELLRRRRKTVVLAVNKAMIFPDPEKLLPCMTFYSFP